jgi:hypothetical protein
MQLGIEHGTCRKVRCVWRHNRKVTEAAVWLFHMAVAVVVVSDLHLHLGFCNLQSAIPDLTWQSRKLDDMGALFFFRCFIDQTITISATTAGGL